MNVNERRLTVKREKVKSSNIKSIGYESLKSTLEIEFTTGAVYQYLNVPQRAWSNLMASKSKGFYFAKYIKHNYRYERV